MRVVRVAFWSILILTGTGVQASGPDSGLQDGPPESGRFVETDRGCMVPYEVVIPGTQVAFTMEPIPGGQVVVGTDGRRYQVEPFWMGRCEITWAEYRQFMELYDVFKQFEIQQIRPVTEQNELDAVTAPTPLYEPTYTFEYGDDPRQPAITVTPYAARQYTKWLSAVTGQQFRLPSEAEWVHACRAGQTTGACCGMPADRLAEYAWFAGNTDGTGPQKVGQKKPNAWGLYDMLGNVAELVLDGPDPTQPADPERVLLAARDWIRPSQPDHRKACGGSWESAADECRCDTRILTVDEVWKETDPNEPKSPWWFTDDPARGVGFRIMRPLKPVSRDAMEEYWKIDDESLGWAVFDRLDEGRGVRGLVDQELPAAIEALKAQ